jgi:PAS domain S-box-containing protein
MIQEKKFWWLILLGLLLLFGLWVTTLQSYLLFHSLAEICSIVIAFTVFVLAWNLKQYIRNNYIVFIGIAYLFVAGIDFIHMLAYKGMGVFQLNESNLSTQLWIVGRYLQSISLVVATFFIGRKLKANILLIVYLAITCVLLSSIFAWEIFPACFVEGAGLTDFKIVSEYIISGMLVLALFLLIIKRQAFEKSIMKCLVASFIMTIFSELSFTLYVDVYGIANFVGHIFKIVAFYFLYRAIVEVGIRQPFSLFLRDQKLEEKRKLEESEAKLRAFIDGSDDAIAIRDRERRLLLWNPSFAKSVKINCGVDIRIGMRVEDYVSDDVLAKFKTQRDRLSLTFAGEPQRAEFEFPCLDGKIRCLETQWTPIWEDDEIVAVAETTRDITEQKKYEHSIQEAEKRYRTVADFTYDWEYWENPEGALEYIAPSCERITGYTQLEFMNSASLIRDIIIEEDKEVWNQHRRIASRGKEQQEVQFRIKRKDGGIRWIEHVCQPVKDQKGMNLGFRASNRDITLRKEAEEVVKNSQENLRFLAGKLITAQEEERRRLAREMHDDLTQRLALLAIKAGKIEIESKEKNSPLPAEMLEMKEEIVKLSKDIHDISRQIHPAILDDLGLVKAIQSECDTFSQREEIKVEYDSNNIPSTLPRDVKICIYRIVQESLRNIAKHARTDKAHVLLTCNNGNLCLTIRDSGCGFDAEQVQSKKGIGLTSMQERVRLIQGEFSVESKPGEGTVIKVTVPCDKEQE